MKPYSEGTIHGGTKIPNDWNERTKEKGHRFSCLVSVPSRFGHVGNHGRIDARVAALIGSSTHLSHQSYYHRRFHLGETVPDYFDIIFQQHGRRGSRGCPATSSNPSARVPFHANETLVHQGGCASWLYDSTGPGECKSRDFDT